VNARITSCRACGASIEFVPTPAGGNMPLDLVPVVGGNIEITDGLAVAVTSDGTVRRQSHFVSCPEASSFRRRRPSGVAP